MAGRSAHAVAAITARLARGGILSGSQGSRWLITPADAFTVRDGNAPQAVRISVNAEHGLDRFTAGIETLANLLRTPPAVEVV